MNEHTPTQVLAMTLKRLYPQNPDIVLGREARTIIEAFTAAGYIVVNPAEMSEDCDDPWVCCIHEAPTDV